MRVIISQTIDLTDDAAELLSDIVDSNEGFTIPDWFMKAKELKELETLKLIEHVLPALVRPSALGALVNDLLLDAMFERLAQMEFEEEMDARLFED